MPPEYIQDETPSKSFVQEIASLLGSDWTVGSAYGHHTLEKSSIGQRRLEILEWEKNNRNGKNRSVVGDADTGVPKCLYSGEIGCAVGRLIPDKSLCEKMDASLNSAVDCDFVQNLLPKDVKELGKDFLADLQCLHDRSDSWDHSGLSESGLEYWNSIKENHC